LDENLLRAIEAIRTYNNLIKRPIEVRPTDFVNKVAEAMEDAIENYRNFINSTYSNLGEESNKEVTELMVYDFQQTLERMFN